MSEALSIEFRNVARAYGDNRVLKGLSAILPAGRISVILGMSGVGKSVLLRLALGLEAADDGQVLVGGTDLAAAAPARLRELRREFGVAFQGGALFTALTVRENVEFPLREVGRQRGPRVRQRSDELLELVGLAGAGELPVSALSGGMVKRVALARAVALAPRAVFLDEPSSGLDPPTAAHIDAVIQRLHAVTGATFFVISHDIASARTIADHAGLLHDGRLHGMGPAAAFFQAQDPILRQFLQRRAAGPLREATLTGSSHS